MVPEEVAGVDVHARDFAGDAELDDAPVVAGRAPPPRLPAVHPFSAVGVLVGQEDPAAGLEEVLLGRKELVVGEHGLAAEPLRGEVDQPRERRCFRLSGRIHS